jgi:peptide/nickel transport system substrate-binding protein
MTTDTPRRRPWLKALLALVLVSLVAAACGGDDGGSSGTGGSDTTEDPGTPVAGGSATLLVISEIGTLDPVKMTGSAGSDGLRAFALYGALVAYDAGESAAQPVLAESFEPDPTFTTWTLKLKPGITFSDGTPFDAAAVQANWERAKDISQRSPALTTAMATTALTVTDPTTLTVTLASPNANFDNAVARTALNYIASPTAFRGGTDLTSTAVGAGPFLLDQWLRDDRMVLTKNPDWKGSEGTYLDELTIRVLGDEEQRIDTFVTGQADAFYTATPASVIRAENELSGATPVSVDVTTGMTYVFNTTKPPFDDIRVRKAFVQGVDWQAFADTVFGEGATAATNFTLEGTPWYTEDAALPSYDPDEAQRLIDEYVAEKGGPLEITALAFQQNLDQARAKFIQTSLSQFENIEFEIQVNDSPTNIGKVTSRRASRCTKRCSGSWPRTCPTTRTSRTGTRT